MSIIICDDELSICKLLQKKLLDYGIKKDLEIKTTLFTDPAEMVRSLPEQVDVAFLDVEMPGMDGMEAAAILRKKTPDVHIIFLSGHEEYVFQSFRLRAFRYLLKPLKDQDLEEAMNAVCDLSKTEARLEYRFQDQNWSIPYKDILYFEGMRGKIWIYCAGDRIYRWRGAMAAIAEQVREQGFVMVHQSYVINMRRILKYTSKEVEMDGGKRIPISKLRLNDFKREYIKLGGSTL